MCTRVNLIPIKELSNQHKFAEYREIKRIPNKVLKDFYKMDSLPKEFCLGAGEFKPELFNDWKPNKKRY